MLAGLRWVFCEQKRVLQASNSFGMANRFKKIRSEVWEHTTKLLDFFFGVLKTMTCKDISCCKECILNDCLHKNT